MKLTERQQRKIIAMKEDGMSSSEVGRIMGVDPNTVRMVLRRNGINPQMSDPVIGHGFEDYRVRRRKLLSDAKVGKPEAIIELASLGLTGWWTPETATVISRKGFSAAQIMAGMTP